MTVKRDALVFAYLLGVFMATAFIHGAVLLWIWYGPGVWYCAYVLGELIVLALGAVFVWRLGRSREVTI